MLIFASEQNYSHMRNQEIQVPLLTLQSIVNSLTLPLARFKSILAYKMINKMWQRTTHMEDQVLVLIL
jgi:hypothetical protein